MVGGFWLKDVKAWKAGRLWEGDVFLMLYVVVCCMFLVHFRWWWLRYSR